MKMIMKEDLNDLNSSMVIVISFREVGAPLEHEESKSEFMDMLINAGLLGDGTVASFPSMKRFSSIVGRSMACSCTRKSPI
jgi:hypothetical protein